MPDDRELDRLRASALFLESIVENLPHVIFVKDAEELRFVLLNRACEALVGRDRADTIGRSDHELFPADEASFFVAKDREVLTNGELVDIPEEPLHTPAGVRWLHTKKIPLRGADGRPRYLLGISDDITERKRTAEQLQRSQEDLRASEGRLRVLLEHFPGATWKLDRAGRVISAEGVHADDLGLRADRSPALADPAVAAAQQTALDGALATCELTHLARNYHVIVTPIDDGAIAVAVDVTHRYRLEAERVEARLRDVQHLETLGSLVGGVAHEFNNLLQVVLGNAGLARLQANDAAAVTHHLGLVEAAAARAGELTRQLLASAGTGSGRAEPVDLSAVIAEMEPLLALRAGASELVTRLEPGLLVHGDAVQLRQLVLNLVANAAEAMGDDGGTLGVVVEAGGQGAERVQLRVVDTGPGVAPELTERIFEPFFTTKANGPGLGLPASLGIARAHRGAITVRGTDDGTEVLVDLPRWSPPPLTPAPSGGRTLLVVDDDDLVRAFTVRALERAGYDVTAAPDGAVALARFAPGRFAGVVLDLTMPGIGGHEVLARMREQDPHVRVLVTTGYDEHAVALDGVTILTKPYGPSTLLEQIDRLIRS